MNKSSTRNQGDDRRTEKPLILVAEDEPGNRTLLNRFLTMGGFDVLEAADGLRAVDAFRANQDQINLCLIDMNMPGLDGASCIEKIRTLSKSVPICLASGDAEAHDGYRRIKQEIALLIPKPFNWPSLAGQISNVLKPPR